MAINTHRQLGMANGAGAKSMEKLSSGLRVNRAADDAAGLSISEKMRNQVRGLNRASSNSQDGISLIQTAEGALDETHSILKRMRELAVQAGNEATLQEDDMDAIKDEFTELSKEIDGISFKTEFNGKRLLANFEGEVEYENGYIKEAKEGFEGVLQVGANEKQQMDIEIKLEKDADDTESKIKAGGITAGNLGVQVTDDESTGISFKYEDATTAADIKDITDNNLSRLDGANKAVSKVRSKLGADQNRLEHTIKNLDNAAENIQAAESRIRDVDMAKEMIENTRQNILQQVSTAMLAQANMAPQSVLQLLG